MNKFTKSFLITAVLACSISAAQAGNDLNKDEKRGLATVSALAAAQVTPTEKGSNAISLAAAGYDDKVGAGVGVGRKWDDHFTTRAAVAYSGENKAVGWTVGAQYQWK